MLYDPQSRPCASPPLTPAHDSQLRYDDQRRLDGLRALLARATNIATAVEALWHAGLVRLTTTKSVPPRDCAGVSER